MTRAWTTVRPARDGGWCVWVGDVFVSHHGDRERAETAADRLEAECRFRVPARSGT